MRRPHLQPQNHQTTPAKDLQLQPQQLMLLQALLTTLIATANYLAVKLVLLQLLVIPQGWKINQFIPQLHPRHQLPPHPLLLLELLATALLHLSHQQQPLARELTPRNKMRSENEDCKSLLLQLNDNQQKLILNRETIFFKPFCDHVKKILNLIQLNLSLLYIIIM